MFRLIPLAVALAALSTPAFADGKGDTRCALYGPGFTYLPDSGTCIKIEGEVRSDTGFGKGKTHYSGSSTTVKGKVDVRRDTDWGPFRAVIEGESSKY